MSAKVGIKLGIVYALFSAVLFVLFSIVYFIFISIKNSIVSDTSLFFAVLPFVVPMLLTVIVIFWIANMLKRIKGQA